MPKATKQALAAATKNAKKSAKTPSQPQKGKGKAAQVKQASKPIKKNSQASSVKSKASTKVSTQASTKSAKAPTFKRPSAQPKKPGNSYQFFSIEMHAQMKNMAKFKNMPFQQRSQVVSQSWSKLGEEQKSEYNKCALEDKKRFERELKQIEKKGFFIDKDGKDSRDLYKAPKGTSEDKEMKDDSPKKKSGKAAKDDRKSSVKKDEKKKKEEDNVTKPKRPFSPYFCFMLENQAKVKKANPEMTITEICKKSASDWKNITDSQMKKYEELSKQSKERFEKEQKEFEETGFFTNSEGVNSKFLDKKHRVQEFARGTVVPKQPRTPWICYFTEQQNLFKTQLKEGEKYSVSEKTKQISETWGKLTAQKKAKYEKLSQQDHERNKKQYEDLRKNGFFTDENGVKSTDMVFKPKKTPVKKVKKQDAEATKE